MTLTAPRKFARYQLDLATRSTDVRMVGNCPGSLALKHLGSEQTPATFLELGTRLHQTIEKSVLEDLDLDAALGWLCRAIDGDVEDLGHAEYVIESRARTLASMHDDARRLLTAWFDRVHPDSPKRLEIYGSYQWPPRVEVPFLRSAESAGTKYPVWGTVDALFAAQHGDGLAVVDWKGGTNRQRDDYQLHHYRFGLDVPDAKAWFHNLDKPRATIQEAELYPGDPAVRQRIRATEEVKLGILEDGFARFQPSKLCRYCPVADSCPAIARGREREQKMSDLRRRIRLASESREA